MKNALGNIAGFVGALLLYNLVPVLEAVGDGQGLAPFIVLAAAIGCLIGGGALVSAVQGSLARRKLRALIRRLVTQEPRWASGAWELPAPESYMLLTGLRGRGSDAFKAGFMQLLTMKVFAIEEWQMEGMKGRQAVLARSVAVPAIPTGSLNTIYQLWNDTPGLKTAAGLAREARKQYKSLDNFGPLVVLPRLQVAGICDGFSPQYRLTPAGLAAQADLEVRVGSVLRQMVDGRSRWLKREPLKTLLTAVLAVSTGAGVTSAERSIDTMTAELARLQGPEPEPVAAASRGAGNDWPTNQYGYRGVWACERQPSGAVDAPAGRPATAATLDCPPALVNYSSFDWRLCEDIDRYFDAIDTAVDAGDSGGDAGGGDGGGDGGGGGD